MKLFLKNSFLIPKFLTQKFPESKCNLKLHLKKIKYRPREPFHSHVVRPHSEQCVHFWITSPLKRDAADLDGKGYHDDMHLKTLHEVSQTERLHPKSPSVWLGGGGGGAHKCVHILLLFNHLWKSPETDFRLTYKEPKTTILIII